MIFWYLAVIASFTFMYTQATHGWVPFGLPAPRNLHHCHGMRH
jgi:hypothetical protein